MKTLKNYHNFEQYSPENIFGKISYFVFQSRMKWTNFRIIYFQRSNHRLVLMWINTVYFDVTMNMMYGPSNQTLQFDMPRAMCTAVTDISHIV